MAEPDDPFLTRWSRRKRSEREGAEPSETGEPSKADPEAHPDEAEIVAQLPDIDSLDENSDFTVFLQDGVPEALRRRALRKLWRLNPVFANLDGLNDYDEDFTLATSALTAVKTVYKVGKGMISDEDEEPVPSAAETPEQPTPVAESPEQPAGEEEERERAQPVESESQEDNTEAAPVADSTTADSSEAPVAPSGRSAVERRWGAIRRG